MLIRLAQSYQSYHVSLNEMEHLRLPKTVVRRALLRERRPVCNIYSAPATSSLTCSSPTPLRLLDGSDIRDGH